jgi:hypothetical protein
MKGGTAKKLTVDDCRFSSGLGDIRGLGIVFYSVARTICNFEESKDFGTKLLIC